MTPAEHAARALELAAEAERDIRNQAAPTERGPALAALALTHALLAALDDAPTEERDT